MTVTERQQEVEHAISDVLAKTPDWITFYRETLGLRGIVRRCFPTRELLAEFETTETYRHLQQTLNSLRKRGPAASDPDDPIRVVTVRLPKSLHDALRVEAHEHRTSMNKLCVSKLLQIIDEEMVPSEL